MSIMACILAQEDGHSRRTASCDSGHVVFLRSGKTIIASRVHDMDGLDGATCVENNANVDRENRCVQEQFHEVQKFSTLDVCRSRTCKTQRTRPIVGVGMEDMCGVEWSRDSRQAAIALESVHLAVSKALEIGQTEVETCRIVITRSATMMTQQIRSRRNHAWAIATHAVSANLNGSMCFRVPCSHYLHS